MTDHAYENILVIGFGNPAREDDGLGPAAASIIEELGIEGVTVDSDYQLTVEDAAAVADHGMVVFIDASVDCEAPYTFTQLMPKRQESFSSHSVAPEGVLGLAEDLFNASPAAYMLGIRGYSFAMFKETMTLEAQENLQKAMSFLEPFLCSNLINSANHNCQETQ